MLWIGWVIAAGLGIAYYRAVGETRNCARAMVRVQFEMAKLAGLWSEEVKSRRALEDEYYKTNESAEAECAKRYDSAPERFNLYPVAYVEDMASYMFRSNSEPWNPTLLQHDPDAWGKRLVQFILSFDARRAPTPKP